MEIIINSVGLISSILIAIMFIPQVIHVYKTKDTRAINYSFLLINMLASTMGLIYYIYFTVIQKIVENTSAELFSITLIIMKYIKEVREKTTTKNLTDPEV